jgi:hypothetical protein
MPFIGLPPQPRFSTGYPPASYPGPEDLHPRLIHSNPNGFALSQSIFEQQEVGSPLSTLFGISPF